MLAVTNHDRQPLIPRARWPEDRERRNGFCSPMIYSRETKIGMTYPAASQRCIRCHLGGSHSTSNWYVDVVTLPSGRRANATLASANILRRIRDRRDEPVVTPARLSSRGCASVWMIRSPQRRPHPAPRRVRYLLRVSLWILRRKRCPIRT